MGLTAMLKINIWLICLVTFLYYTRKLTIPHSHTIYYIVIPFFKLLARLKGCSHLAAQQASGIAHGQ